ncbi:MAG: CD1247 N-terminal domain-containing protein [Syntrophomonadaceae bacterium]
MSRDISEQVSYLQGLTEGLNINDGGPQGKIISGILEVLNEITVNIRDIRGDIFELSQYLDCIDEDLCELQEAVMDDLGENDRIEVQCTNCREKLYFDADVLEGEDIIEIICPRCNEVVFVNDGSFDYEPGFIEDENLDMDQSSVNPSPS